MQAVTPERSWPLFDVTATRRLEQAAAARFPAHTLMQRAGLATARLALAIAPHARRIWIACGPGNNGGDGLEAAMHLQRWGKQPLVTWLGDENHAPADALASFRNARDAGVEFAAQPPEAYALCIDALLGIGASRAPDGKMADWVARMNAGTVPVLSIDLPSGLGADTGGGSSVLASHTLALLALKPGLFTAQGRDASGQVWLDDLGLACADAPVAWLQGPPAPGHRAHASHKGSYGDVAVIGGAPGMVGAALLAACAALHSGAGRVFVGLLDAAATHDPGQPELMLRPWRSLDMASLHLACGCGGGDAIRAALPQALSGALSLVLDADALNALAADNQLQTLLQALQKAAHAGDPIAMTALLRQLVPGYHPETQPVLP